MPDTLGGMERVDPDHLACRPRPFAPPPSAAAILRLAGCGFIAYLLAIGLARFAYTPLIPALVGANWFSPSQAVYLGAANLAGYLAGALTGRSLARRWSTIVTLRAMMVLIVLSFFACATPSSFAWFFVWRFLSGFAGAVLMVLAAPAVLPHIPARWRWVASGIVFAGAGLGIAVSGVLVPALLAHGLAATWLGLGALSLVLMAIGWSGWRTAEPAPAAPPAVSASAGRTPVALKALYGEYALNAFALVPHMVFLVDFVARGLGRGLESGAQAWVAVGLGATAGPILTSTIGGKIGFRHALRLGFVIQIVAVGALAFVSSEEAILLSSLIVGIFMPGLPPLVLGRIHEIAAGHAEAQGRAWSFATVAFALGQAAGAYGLSFLFARTGDHAMLFAIGASACILALLLDLGASLKPGRQDGSASHSTR